MPARLPFVEFGAGALRTVTETGLFGRSARPVRTLALHGCMLGILGKNVFDRDQVSIGFAAIPIDPLAFADDQIKRCAPRRVFDRRS